MKSKILLIDDNEDFLEVMSMLLEIRGYIATPAHGGLEGVELFKNDPDIVAVIVDLNMPGMSGSETVSALLDIRPVKIWIATGLESDPQLDDALRSKVVDVLAKPVDFNELLADVDLQLRSA